MRSTASSWSTFGRGNRTYFRSTVVAVLPPPATLFACTLKLSFPGRSLVTVTLTDVFVADLVILSLPGRSLPAPSGESSALAVFVSPRMSKRLFRFAQRHVIVARVAFAGTTTWYGRTCP